MQQDNSKRGAIIDRIRRLQAQADKDGATEAEAASFAAAVDRLAVKYAISLDELEEEERRQVDPQGVHRFSIGASMWRRWVAHGVSEFFSCSTVLEGKGRAARYVIIGGQVDRELAVHLYEVATRHIEAAASAHREVMAEMGVGSLRRELNDFRKSAAVAFGEMLAELRERSTTSGAQAATTALVVASRMDRALAERARRYPRLKTAARSFYRPNSAGEAAGRSVPVQGALGGSGARSRQLGG